MKKTLALVLVLLLCLPAFALADDLEITQSAFYVTPYLSYHAGEIFCEITNTTDRAIEVSSSVFELFGADNASIAAGSVYSIYPRVVEPGEKCWLMQTSGVKEAATSDYIKDYSVSVVGKSAKETPAHYQIDNVYFGELPGSYSRTGFFATVTNNTDEVAGNMLIVFAAYAADGQFLLAQYTSSSGLALHPGSSADMYTQVDKDLLNCLAAEGLAIDHVEAVVYTY